MKYPTIKFLKSPAITLVLTFVFLLAACSSDDGPTKEDVDSGTIRVEVTYPDNFMDYKLEVLFVVTTYDYTKIGIDDVATDYLNDSDFVAVHDPEPFFLAPGNAKHVFETSDFALTQAMNFDFNGSPSEVEEGVSINLKIYFNNSLAKEITLETQYGEFDFTWTPKDFIHTVD